MAAPDTTDSLVAALRSGFESGLRVLRKLRKKTKRGTTQPDGEEVRLAQSLKKGPADIAEEYERSITLQGPKFREGDPKAHASLAATLVRLNNGLVNIITSFLTCGSKDVHLDYRTLTSLSESSRADALDALSQLSYRLSQSSLSLLRPTQLPNNLKKQRKRKKSEASLANTATVRRIQASNASAPQLSVVRPRPKRVPSTSSSRPQPAQKQHKKSGSASSTAGPPPSSATFTKSTPSLLHMRPTALPTPPDTPPLPSQPLSPPALTDLDAIWRRRRQDVATPSMATFASGSTKLGEIPMRKWNVPLDYAEMERKNAEAVRRVPVSVQAKKKGGFFSRFRKAEGEVRG